VKNSRGGIFIKTIQRRVRPVDVSFLLGTILGAALTNIVYVIILRRK
jgi:hypothetical protein